MRGNFVASVPRTPSVVAVSCLLVTLGVTWFLVGQLRDAARIDAHPVRVRGVIERVESGKGGESARVGYDLAGRHYSEDNLPTAHMPGDVAVGARLCLEAAADDPGTVRLCGRRYPAGDDALPTAALTIVGGTAGTLCAASFAVSGLRARRRAGTSAETREAAA